MKIAILASVNGEKAIYLHDFFKEGNRITVDCLLTDNPESPIAQKMRSEGIDVIYISPEKEMEEIVELMKRRDVELLVVDDFDSEVPHALSSHFGESIVYPGGKESAPLEVISTTNRLRAAANARAQQPQFQKKEERREEVEENGQSTVDKEWAEALNVDITNEVPVPEKEMAETPVSPLEPPQVPQPPEYKTVPPNYPFNGYNPAPGNNNYERMPETYLVWSVILTIVCCLIPGIIAIVYSASVSSKYFAGDIEGAKRASRNAQIWCIVAVVAGVIWATLYLPLALIL